MRFAVAVLLGLAMGGCAATGAADRAGPYDWGGYDTALYNVYSDPGTAQAGIARLKSHVERLEQSGRKVPPGLYADLGSLCLQVGEQERAQAYYRKERALWPDSAVLMDALTSQASVPAANGAAGAWPRSILVVPPLNQSSNPDAADFVATTLGAPLAQKGYYVFPMHTARLVLEQKGMRSAEAVQARPAAELAQLFGADAVLFVTVKRWDRQASLAAQSAVLVDVDYRLVDRSGKEIWKTSKKASVQSHDRVGGTHYGESMRDTLNAQTAPYIKTAGNPVPLARSANAQALVEDPGFIPDGPYAAAP